MVVQFYDIKKNIAYAAGWTFPSDCETPMGGWVRVESRRKVALSTLKRKAISISREIEVEVEQASDRWYH